MPPIDPSNTVVTEQTYGQSPNAGSSNTYSRGDHTHGTSQLPSIPQSSTTVISEQSFGQSSNVGTLTTYAREDHTHGTPTLPLSNGFTTQSFPARTLDTIYTNNTGKTIFVSTSFIFSTASIGTARAQAFVDLSNPPMSVVSECGPFNCPSNISLLMQMTFMVPNGYSYQIYTGGTSVGLTNWTEWV